MFKIQTMLSKATGGAAVTGGAGAVTGGAAVGSAGAGAATGAGAAITVFVFVFFCICLFVFVYSYLSFCICICISFRQELDWQQVQVLEQARGQQVTNNNVDNLLAKGKDHFKQFPTLFWK